LPERLAKHGKISLDRTEICKKIGQLFIERNSVNLYSDILDTPEFFWEQEQYQAFYHRIYSYLEIGKRVAVLNKRLDIMRELFEMLSAELQDRHSSNLEWIIIWLIVVEVVIEVVWQIIIKDSTIENCFQLKIDFDFTHSLFVLQFSSCSNLTNFTILLCKYFIFLVDVSI
jgi:uncharacterized Rmd1/YagE family protein